MIIPTLRLLICYAATIPPLALISILGDATAVPARITVLLLVLLALVDAALSYGSLQGIGVNLPTIVHMAKDREGVLELSVQDARQQAKTVRVGLPFPLDIVAHQEELIAVLPRGVPSTIVRCPCLPRKRGQFHIDACYLEARSPLGLWAVREKKDAACEIRVYANLARERNNLAALFLNRGGFGIHPRRQYGKGKEFEKLREYIPGDAYDEIHWKTTAKRRHPITKVFQIERTQEVYVIIDASRLSARLPRVEEVGAPKDCLLPVHDSYLERFIVAALIAGLAAQKQGDHFGVLTFSDAVHGFLRAGGGKAHYSACREHIYDLQPRMVNPDYEELCTYIRLNLRRRALLLILTSLDDPLLAETFTRTMELICRHHLIMVTMLRPEGVRPIFSNPTVASYKDIYRELGGHTLWHNLQELERTLAHRGIGFALTDHERLCVELVSQYMNVKQRQLL